AREQTADGCERVPGGEAAVGERPQGVRDLVVAEGLVARGLSARDPVDEVAEEDRASSAEGVVDRPLDGSEAVGVGRREGGGGAVGEVEADPRVVPGEGSMPRPEDLAARKELVDEGADGLVDACGEDERFEGTGGYRGSGPLPHHPAHAGAP